VRRAVLPIGVAVVATVVAAFLVPNRTLVSPTVAAYLTCLAACAAWGLLGGRISPPSGRRDLLRSALGSARRRPRATWPHDLVQLQRMISAASGSALDAQFWLQPRLRELACALLQVRRGLVLDARSDDLASALGVAGEPLLQPRPEWRRSTSEPGASAADIAALLDRMEAI